MIKRSYREVPGEEEVEGVTLRWMIGIPQGAPDFALRVLDVEPGASTPDHQHRWQHQVYVVSGRGYVRTEEGEVRVMSGDAVYLAPDEHHQFVNDSDDVLQFVCIIATSQGRQQKMTEEGR